MKKLLTIGLLVCWLSGTYAQTITQSVIAAGGGNAILESQGLSVNWTIGEPITGTLVSSDQTIILTQGFQQGGVGGGIIVVPVAFLPEISVYPNPISSFINIQIENAPRDILSIKIIDLKGIVVASYNNINADQLITINATSFIPGVYLIHIFKPRQLLKSLQIVKQ